MMYLDLDELDEVLALSPWWSAKPWRPARFERSDYFGDPGVPLGDAVRNRIFEECGERHNGPVRMLANLRYFGFNINPITCYYCFDDLENLKFIVSEVTNTPWKERKSYVLKCDSDKPFQRINFNKEMHVSPFNPMEMTYRWCSNNPSKILSLNLETHVEGTRHLDATMALKRREIDSSSLALILIEHPWMTAKVMALIYWQALKLAIKKAPFYDHPEYHERNLSQPSVKKIKA
jgi:DUF1365 family protein